MTEEREEQKPSDKIAMYVSWARRAYDNARHTPTQTDRDRYISDAKRFEALAEGVRADEEADRAKAAQEADKESHREMLRIQAARQDRLDAERARVVASIDVRLGQIVEALQEICALAKAEPLDKKR